MVEVIWSSVKSQLSQWAAQQGVSYQREGDLSYSVKNKFKKVDRSWEGGHNEKQEEKKGEN